MYVCMYVCTYVVFISLFNVGQIYMNYKKTNKLKLQWICNAILNRQNIKLFWTCLNIHE